MVVEIPETCTATPAALLRLAQRRDAEAWLYLVERHGSEMLHAARRITGDPHLAEDVCQEALLLIRDHAGQFKPQPGDEEASARSWILRVTCNTALKLLRTGRRAERRNREATEMKRMNGDDFASGDCMEHAERTQLLEAVRFELQRLPESLQLPVALRLYSGLELKQIAIALQISEAATRKRIDRGVSRLRKRMALLGIALAAAELAEACAPRNVQAVAATETTGVQPEHFAHWKGLLHSSQHAALNTLAYSGGISLMTKVMIAALLALTGALAFHAGRAQTSQHGVVAPTAPPAPAAPIAATPPAAARAAATPPGSMKEISFGLGHNYWVGGDSITITSVKSDQNDFQIGGTYEVSGRYELKSHDKADLCVYGTANNNHGTDAVQNSKQVVKGAGEFTLSFKIVGACWPHVTLYPDGGGEGFSGVYFGNGVFLHAGNDIAHPTDKSGGSSNSDF